MELVPIFNTVLLVSLVLLIIVLVFSMFSSKKQKEEDKENYKEIIKQRKIAYSKEQLEYLKKMRDRRHTEFREDNLEHKPKHNNPATKELKQHSSGSIKTRSDYSVDHFNPNKSLHLNNGQRYSILNETFNSKPLEEKHKSNKELYPLELNKTGKRYG